MLKTHCTKLVLAMLCLLFLGNTTIAQNWSNQLYTAEADYKLQFLNKTPITTGILYDRVMPIANIERFKPTLSTDTTSSIIFKQAYHELFSSMLTQPAGMLNYEGLDSSLNNLEYANMIPIGLMHYNYHALDSNAFTNGQIDTLPNGQLIDAPSQTQSPYVQQQFFMAAPLLGSDFVVEEDEPIVFYFDDRFFLQNTGITITEIRIDFPPLVVFFTNNP